MTGYYIACAILTVLILAFFPAMAAAYKQHRFSRWYVYAVFLLPVAAIHSVLLKKPVRAVGIYVEDKSNPLKRRKKIYKCVPVDKEKITITPKQICAIFFSKLIFGGFMGLVLFAIFRVFTSDSSALRVVCLNFSIVFSLLLGVVEICGFSAVPLIADEITKRALIIFGMSAGCSVPFFFIRVLILDKILPDFRSFNLFICSMAVCALFLIALLQKQRLYYSFFSGFFDYTGISIMAYSVYAAVTLIMISIPPFARLVPLFASHLQLLSLRKIANAIYPGSLSFIYAAALVHLFVGIIILFSGLACYAFKKKEIEARIEYRSAAFRMSRKRILRRHIPVSNSRKVSPIKG